MRQASLQAPRYSLPMIISQKTVWLAVHGVFAARGVGLGGSLLLKDMMDAWVDCRLRQSDLGAGLESLICAGYLEIKASVRGPVVRMLDERFGLVDAGKADRKAAQDLIRVREMRRPPATGTHGGSAGIPASGRRREDLVAPDASTA